MKFNKWTVALAASGLISFGSVVQADEASNGVMTSLSKTTLSGYVDTAVTYSDSNVKNGLLGYQGRTSGIDLNVFKLVLEKPLDEGDWAAGYRVDLLAGPDAILYNPVGADDGILGIKQAYVATRAPIGNGLDLKLGVFDTIIGYEVFENAGNPNMSRSYGWNNEPTQHTGLVGAYQINDMIGFSAGIANTSNAVINQRPSDLMAGDDGEDLSYLASVTISAPDSMGLLAGSALYLGVVDGLTGNGGDDQTNWYVGATTPTPIEGLGLGIAYDDAQNVAGTSSDATSLALYASYQATDKMALHGRIDWLDDEANDDEYLALTATLDYALWDNVLTRLEGRWDSLEEGTGVKGGFGDDIFSLTLNAIYQF
jgi:hypothetical protein